MSLENLEHLNFLLFLFDYIYLRKMGALSLEINNSLFFICSRFEVIPLDFLLILVSLADRFKILNNFK